MTGDRETWTPEPGRIYHENVRTPAGLELRKVQLAANGWEITSTKAKDHIYILGLAGFSDSYSGHGWVLSYRLLEVSDG